VLGVEGDKGKVIIKKDSLALQRRTKKIKDF